MANADARPNSTEAFLDIDATYGGLVSITGGVFDSQGAGAVFYKASGRNQDDPSIFAPSTVNVKMSKAQIFSHFGGNTTETVIATIDTPVKINAVWSDINTTRFSFNANGTWTYTGLEDKDISMSIVATVTPAGGTARQVSTYFAKNGVVDAATRGSVTASTGGQITNLAIISVSTGDTVEVFIENNSGTQNITVEIASLRIP